VTVVRKATKSSDSYGYSNNYHHDNCSALLQKISVSVTKPVRAGSVIKVACFQHVKTYFSVTLTATIMIICILAFLMLFYVITLNPCVITQSVQDKPL
jgi:hypothetical protein